MTMSLKECRAHIPKIPAQAIEKYAIEEVFKFQRYIFTTRQGKRQHGYCTYCHKDFPTSGLSHNKFETCPECGSRCIVKASGLGRKRLVDEAYFTYYLKSAIDPQAIVAISMYAVRDFSGHYRGVRTRYTDAAMYVFKPGIGGYAFHRRWYYYSQAKTMNVGDFNQAKSVKCRFNYGHNLNIHTTYSRESIAAAVVGTPYRYSTWEHYTAGDMTEFFDMYSRYPCIEYLTKLGFSNLVADKLDGERTYSAISWRGKNMLQVLRMSKAELQEIRTQKINITFFFLKLFQISKRDGSNLTPAEVSEIHISEAYLNYLHAVLKYTSLRNAVGYLKKQHKKHFKHFNSQESVLLAWKDYIDDCLKLEMDLTRENVLSPRNLHRSHQNTIKQIKNKADKELNKSIRDRFKGLYKQYYFEHQGLMIRPALDSGELIVEGKALNHCVGNYAKRYASGEIVLLFIRKTAEPDEPYYTVEVKNNAVIQVRGFENCNPVKPVAEFVEAFTAEKLQSKKAKSRARIPA